MPFSAPVLEDGIAASPRLYAAAFRSAQNRFKGPNPEKVQITNLEYDIDLFETSSNVQVHFAVAYKYLIHCLDRNS